MKVVLTGSSGLLGSALKAHFLSNGIQVKCFDRNNFHTQTLNKHVEFLKSFDCLIHAAANTNVEECEQNPLQCYKDNTYLTERLAIAASKANCKFVYIF